MKTSVQKTTIFLLGLYVCLYLLPLGIRPLFVPDETRYFAIPSEMIASGDWVVPHLNGLRYFEKPVLGYWLNAVAMELFGQNAFAVRFPSAASVGLSALFLFFLVRKFAGGVSAGLFTTTIFLTCSQVWAIGDFSLLDSQLAMMLTGAVVTYFGAYKSTASRRKTFFLILCGLFCGLAFLTKGFLAFVVPILTLFPFMAWEGRLKEFFKTAWIPITAAIVISLPWCIMIALREGDFWHYFFWIEHVKRFLSAKSGQHPQPLWFYVPGLIVGALPWSVLLPAIGIGTKDADQSEPLFRLAVCWLLFPFLFFSASSGKLLTYILPCFPPLAILMGEGLRRYLQSGTNRAYLIGSGLLGGILITAALLFAFNQLTGFLGTPPYTSHETLKWIFACSGLIIWGIITLSSNRIASPNTKMAAFALAPVLFLFTANFLIPDTVLQRKAPGKLLCRNLSYIQPNTQIIADTGTLHAACTYFKRTDIYLIGGLGELAYGLSYDDSKARRLDQSHLKRLIQQHTGGSPSGATLPSIALAIKRGTYKKNAHLLPPPTHFDQYGKFVFLTY